MNWNLKEIYDGRFEWIRGHYTIDVNIMGKQGLPGSNMVTVSNKYGFLLNTPRKFRTIKEAKKFVQYAKRQLDNGKIGKIVYYE